MTVQITVFDGARCIGGSKIHLLAGKVGIFLDFGMNFAKYGRYFEEFVQPRAARGIHDLWVLDLIPHLEGVYRGDIFPGDFTVKDGKRIKVNAVFVSHAHLDHSGNIGLIDSSIPAYASGMTAAIIKAMQDCGRSSFEIEIAYASLRQATEQDPRVIATVKGATCQGRPVKIVDKVVDIDRLNSFWQQTFSSKKIDSIHLCSADSKIEDVDFRAFPVDHSIFGATAYAFETPAGWIVYSGDLRLHGIRGHLTQKFVDEVAELKPAALIIEGTSISETKGTSEDEVQVNCQNAVQQARGKLVIADFGPRNIERLQIFLQIARETGRKLLVTAKDAFLLYAMHLANNAIPDVLNEQNLGIFDEVKASRNKWEKDFIRTRYADKYISSQEVARDHGSYILAFGFFDLKHLLDVMPEEGIYVYSTSEAFSEEMEIDVRRLKNWLDFFRIKPVGFDVNRRGQLEFTKGYHASGHISGDELIEVVNRIKPQILIPVHTEKPELFREKLSGEPIEVRLPEEGIPIKL